MIKSNLSEDVGENRVKDYQKYLESPKESNLIKLASMLSPNNQFVVDQTNLGIKLTKDAIKKQFAIAFTMDEIHKECMKYNMTFIRTTEYTGEYSIDLLEKIDNFVKKTGIKSTDDDFQRLVYILAPAKGDAPGTAVRYPCKDPLVFWKYSVSGVGGAGSEYYYILIDGDKSYVNIINRWLGFKNYNQITCRVAHTIEIFAVLYGIFFLCSNLLGWTSGLQTATSIFLLSAFLHTWRMLFRKSKDGLDNAFRHKKSYFLQYKHTD